MTRSSSPRTSLALARPLAVALVVAIAAAHPEVSFAKRAPKSHDASTVAPASTAPRSEEAIGHPTRVQWRVPDGPAAGATDVTIERSRPEKEKHATLRFLEANRDFIRAQFDLLREQARAFDGTGGAIDPRFLAYREMMRDVVDAHDTLTALRNARERQTLLASVTELGGLETRLDILERQLADQRARLGVLQEDFTGDQRTELVVVVSGPQSGPAVAKIVITLEQGDPITIPLTDPDRESLAHGGVLEIFRGLIEPRQQAIAIGLGGDAWGSGDTGFVTLDPSRDRLTFLKLDLSQVDPRSGATGIRASTWRHDATLTLGR